MSDTFHRSPPRSARKAKGEGHVRRGEILKVAERLFAEQGYEGATIRKIAEEVGLSSTALYMHFSDKSEILYELCRSAFEQLIAATGAIMQQDLPVDEKLRQILAAYGNFALANPNAYRLVYLTRPLEAEHGAQSAAQDLGGDLFRDFLSLVYEIEAQGRLKTPPAVAAQVLWAGVHGVVSLIITKPYFNWAGSSELIDTMIDSLKAGLIRA